MLHEADAVVVGVVAPPVDADDPAAEGDGRDFEIASRRIDAFPCMAMIGWRGVKEYVMRSRARRVSHDGGKSLAAGVFPRGKRRKKPSWNGSRRRVWYKVMDS